MTEKLLALRVEELLDAFADGDADPGSGSAAALVVSMAAGLVAKAARRSREDWSEASGAAAQAQALRVRAAALADTDAEAYRDALQRLALRDGSDHLLADALDEAAEVPLVIARAAADVAALAREVAERCDLALRPDVTGAAILAAAAARAAAQLVEANLTVAEEDPRVREALTYAEAALDSARG